MFLLDTNVVSEMEKTSPDPGLVAWLESADWSDLFLSAISIAEIKQGILALPDGKRRRALEVALELLPDRFAGRILPVDAPVALRYAEIQADAGPLPILDTLLAATALVNHLTLVTRNTKDLARTGVRILDPWSR